MNWAKQGIFKTKLTCDATEVKKVFVQNFTKVRPRLSDLRPIEFSTNGHKFFNN